ncbi:hypothetical protein A1O3_04704 [Capronia epimyces CBS 606.96]|uniref:Uncharacterized protein n=1 Tax=Capronia epimyces CBS 606.96 TaxID=1182542 RepID=W9XU10_9EURO|nr:uncharacterized protein A1O3_04704 [Capronia epimyces CBS 606.96]EXJ84037.1 hypothetical protein A1O3_04704 [Capronia epimyces CBS 606.96]
MAGDDANSEQDPAPEESHVKSSERTDTAGSSKATEASKDRATVTDGTAPSKPNVQPARLKPKRTPGPVDADGTSHKKVEPAQPARQTASEKDAILRLLSSGTESDILVDIVAIRDYDDDSSTAWTFNFERFREQLQQKLPELRKVPGEAHEKQTSRASEEDPARLAKGKNAAVDITQAHISAQDSPSGREPHDPSKLHPKNLSNLGVLRMGRRKSHAQADERQVQADKASSVTPLKEEGVTTSDIHNDLNVNWLENREMLPQQMPWARIFTFEYPRQHKERSAKPQQLQSLVSRLSSQLQNVRRGVHGRRPILFLTHDFGFVLFLELLFSNPTDSEGAARMEIRKLTAAVFVFLTAADGSTGNISISKYIRSQSIHERVLPDSLPYAETRKMGYIDKHLKQVEELRNLVPKKAPKPFVQVMIDDGKHFKDPTDKRFLAIVARLTKATQTRLILQATADGKEELLRSYEERGWDLNLSDGTGRSALHFAIITRRMEMLFFLLNCKGIKVDAKDVRGQTALHYAIRMLSRPHGAIALLVDNGADATTKDNNGMAVTDIAREKGIRQSLKTFRAITGPSSHPGMVLQLPDLNTLDKIKQLAAEDCLMAMAEFFNVEEDGIETEKFIMQRPSVFQALYGMYPDDILEVARRTTEMKQKTPVCKWLHLPANHTGWVDGLFARLGLAKESVQVDQHSGKTYWSDYLRPQCRTFKAVRQPLPSTADDRPQRGLGPAAQVAPNAREVRGTLLYMPFLTSERHCDQRVLYDTVVSNRSTWEEEVYYMQGRQFLPPEPPEITMENGSDISEDAVSETTRLRGAQNDALIHEHAMPASKQADNSDADSSDDVIAITRDDEPENRRLDPERELFHAFRDSFTSFGRPLHIRRTLDQSHYLMLEDTTKRDRDQVVLRRQQGRLGSKVAPVSDSADADAEDLKDKDPMVMVDQLWLWVIGDTVISSFPRSWPRPEWEHECDVLDRLIGYINATQQRGPIKSSHDLAKLIIKHCVEVFNHPPREGHYHPLSLHDAFETSVGVIADDEMTLFRQFEEQVFLLKEFEVPEEQEEDQDGTTDTTSGSYYSSYSYTDSDSIYGVATKERKEFSETKTKTVDSSKTLHELPKPKPKQKEAQQSENRILNRLFDIQREIALLDEAKDVHDELRMILRIVGEQKQVMEDWSEILTPTASPESRRTGERMRNRHLTGGSIGSDHMMESADGASVSARRFSPTDVAEEAYATIHSNLKDFTRMLDHVTAAEQGINQLLNLKQKEANALEARFSRKSADAATKQGNTILFFTIVTIIFGSLSFITSFFALNVTAFPLDASTGEPVWRLRKVIGLIIGLSLGLSIPFIVIALTINPTMALVVKGARKVQHQVLLKAQLFLSTVEVLSWLFRHRRLPVGDSHLSATEYLSSSYITESSDDRRRRGLSTETSRGSSHRTDHDQTPDEKIGWVAIAGKSIRRLRPRFKSKRKPSDVANGRGSGSERGSVTFVV